MPLNKSEYRKYFIKSIQNRDKQRNDLKKIILQYIQKYYDIYFDDKINIKLLIKQLYIKLNNDILLLFKKYINLQYELSSSLAKKDNINPKDNDSDKWLSSIMFGLTTKERIKNYVSELNAEIIAYISIGEIDNMTKKESMDRYINKIKYPFNTVILNKYIDSVNVINYINIRRINKNHLNSAYRSLIRIADDLAIVSYSRFNRINWSGKYMYKIIGGGIGSNTCQDCIDQINRVAIPIFEPVTPLHQNCIHYEIPILL